MQFHRALGRKPLPPWMRAPGASGPHKGLGPEQLGGLKLPWNLVTLCTSGSRVDVDMFTALHTTLDTHGALDLLDLKEIQDSWAHATRLNVVAGG